MIFYASLMVRGKAQSGLGIVNRLGFVSFVMDMLRKAC